MGEQGGPCEHVAVGIVIFIRDPSTHLDLKVCVEAMHAHEIVHRGLGVRIDFPSFVDVDVIHQVDCPKVVVDIDNVRVGATEVGNLVRQQIVHVCRLGSKVSCRVSKDGAHPVTCIGKGVVHCPAKGDAFRTTGHFERILLSSVAIFKCGVVGKGLGS